MTKTKTPNIPWIEKPGPIEIAPYGLFPLLTGFRIPGSGLPYKMYLFSFSNPSGSTLEYQPHINTIDKDLIVAYNGADGNFIIKTSTGNPIKGFSKSIMAFTCLTTFYSLLGGTLPYPPVVADEKANWLNNGIPIYTVDGFGAIAAASAVDQLCLLTLFDLPGDQVNFNI